jgi:hypothetical protein
MPAKAKEKIKNLKKPLSAEKKFVEKTKKTKKTLKRKKTESIVPPKRHDLDNYAEEPVVYDAEKDKKLIMWTGISFFMILILFLWVLNINKIFKTSNLNNNINNDLENVSGNFFENFNEIMDGINEFKTLIENSSNSNIVDNEIQLENEEQQGFPESISQEEHMELVRKIEELENELKINR